MNASHGWDTGERVGDLQSLVVLAEARNRGVGARLMDEVETELAARQITELRLFVMSTNSEAIRFYQRRGLTTTGIEMFGRVPHATG